MDIELQNQKAELNDPGLENLSKFIQFKIFYDEKPDNQIISVFYSISF